MENLQQALQLPCTLFAKIVLETVGQPVYIKMLSTSTANKEYIQKLMKQIKKINEVSVTKFSAPGRLPLLARLIASSKLFN